MCEAAKVVFLRSKAKAAAVGEDTGDTGEGLVRFCNTLWLIFSPSTGVGFAEVHPYWIKQRTKPRNFRIRHNTIQVNK